MSVLNRIKMEEDIPIKMEELDEVEDSETIEEMLDGYSPFASNGIEPATQPSSFSLQPFGSSSQGTSSKEQWIPRDLKSSKSLDSDGKDVKIRLPTPLHHDPFAQTLGKGQLPSLQNVLGTRPYVQEQAQIPLVHRSQGKDSFKDTKHPRDKHQYHTRSKHTMTDDEVARATSEESQMKRQFKTEPRRLTYLREKKIYGRNEESEIINGLQSILANCHGAVFYYVKEKRSKKTTKFRMPAEMIFDGCRFSSDQLAEMGETYLVDNALCERCDQKSATTKRIQRSKEAEVNGGLLSILYSLGYVFNFKKLKEKNDRKTTPFVKITGIKFPTEKEFRSVDDLKKMGKEYNDVMLSKEDAVVFV